MKTLFLITARGGSKGIPGKNIKPFCGRALVSRAVDQAIALAEAGDEVCLSTDSEQIKEVVERDCRLAVPFLRPASLATDKSGSYEVIIHALDFYKAQGKDFDRVVLLQPTSPLRTLDDITGAMERWRHDVDMVVSVCEAKTNPYYNAYESGADGMLHISKGDGHYTRRQDAPKVWEYNGAVYVMAVEALRQSPMSCFKRRMPFEMPASHSVDLDTPADWIIAETLWRQLHNAET